MQLTYTTGILSICAIHITLSGEKTIPSMILWQILFAGLVTTAVTIYFASIQAVDTKINMIRLIMHYIALSLTMIGIGYWFHWIEMNVLGIIIMLLSVAFVYVFSMMMYYFLDKKEAEEMNEKLKEKYQNDEKK